VLDVEDVHRWEEARWPVRFGYGLLYVIDAVADYSQSSPVHEFNEALRLKVVLETVLLTVAQSQSVSNRTRWNRLEQPRFGGLRISVQIEQDREAFPLRVLYLVVIPQPPRSSLCPLDLSPVIALPTAIVRGHL
jgi:hypothetical protein